MPVKTVSKARATTVFKTTDDKSLRDQTKEAMENINKSWFIIARNMYLIESTGEWKEWGYESLDHYVKEELGYEPRNMYHRIKVGKTINDLGLTTDQIEGITDWTKFHTLIPLLTADPTEERINFLLNEAKTKTVSQLKQIVQSSKQTLLGGRTVTTTDFNLMRTALINIGVWKAA